MDWTVLAPVTAALVGVTLGAVINGRNEHRLWVRTQRMKMYDEFGHALSQIDYFSSEGVATASSVVGNLETRIELIASPRTVRLMRKLAGRMTMDSMRLTGSITDAPPNGGMAFVNAAQEVEWLAQEVRWSMAADVRGWTLHAQRTRYRTWRSHRRAQRLSGEGAPLS